MFDEVGDRIFRRRYESLDQNIGVILGGESACVIDSRSTHPDADELRGDLARLTTLPVAFLVNTHMHWDHTFGNARFPEAVIVGHVDCRRRLLEEGEAARSRVQATEGFPEEIRQNLGSVEIVPPTVTFRNSIRLHLDDRTIELRWLGRGHTDNDIVVAVDGVCFAGDLVEEGAPPAFGDAYPEEWVTTLDLLLEDLAPTVVPGHGDVVDADFVRAQRDEIAQAVGHLARDEGTAPWPSPVMDAIAARMTSR
ncbi:MAG TPA: MBL fold metallo-hydrolase [Acidimicrobiia bacterium]|nr:MBL fold metallo-hydrolase [Acidimicrobiia bacterium]